MFRYDLRTRHYMTSFTTYFYLLTISIMFQSCHDNRKEADLIICNATIITLDSNDSYASCLAIHEGKIIAVGDDAELKRTYRAERTIDARGLFVYPGFIDAHSHFTGFAEFLRYADLDEARSFEELLAIVDRYHSENPGQWIIGRGWDQNKWPGKEFPDNEMLDRLYPDIPVILSRVDGHAVLANQAAIREAGLKEPFPAGEALKKNGRLTGIFLERTADKLKAAIPRPTPAGMARLIEHAASLCHAAGLTGVNDAGIDKEMILLLDTLQKSGKLKMRVDAMINPTDENMEYFMKAGGYRTASLRVGSVKIYADGALGSRGACLLKPYADDPSNYGIIVTDKTDITRICEKARECGFQVNTHAIGDSAVRMVLGIYAQHLGGRNDHRWRIEHAQVVDEQDFETFGAFSVIPSVQATHATSDMLWAPERLGSDRIRNAYAYRRLLLQNDWIPNGTDFPIENISPVLTFYAAVARKNLQGTPDGGFQPENALSRIEALKSITLWAAKAAFEENNRGSIENGKMGDIVILDRNLLDIPEEDIPAARVIYTILNGEVVYQRQLDENR